MEFTARTLAPVADDYEGLLDDFLRAKADADRANARLRAVEHLLMDHMERNQVKSAVVEDSDLVHRVTFVQRDVIKIDEKGLRRALKAKVYDQYTVKKLDRKALEGAMERGEVDPMIVSQYATVEKSSPYLRYTEGTK